MAFVTQYLLSQDATFRQKVNIAMAKIAIAVVGEAAITDQDKYRKRHDLGVNVLRSPDEWINQFSLAVVADETITTTSTDTEIENMVSAVWNDLAGTF